MGSVGPETHIPRVLSHSPGFPYNFATLTLGSLWAIPQGPVTLSLVAGSVCSQEGLPTRLPQGFS